MTRKFNFNPGPATLPLPALERARDGVVDYAGIGMSVLEISHRSKDFEAILEGAKTSLKELMEIPDNYEICFTASGASLQFMMIPMNFLAKGEEADYVITGSWSKKAIKEAKLFGQANVAASSEEEKFRRIPKPEEIKLSPKAKYVHITTNNTIFGTQWQSFPETGDVPLMADMSSDILSRRIDVGKFGLIYAGAQKNLGPAGVTAVIIRKDLLERCPDDIPTMLNYKTYTEKNSLFNTPPVFAIYLVKLILDWVKEQGGLAAVEQVNRKKGDLLYGLIDEYADFFRSTVDADSRSLMNVTMRLPSEELEKKFIEEAAERDLHGLKGHRSVGGIRVSMYNAMPLEGIEKLTDFLKEFKGRN